jgi:hypothetical protein
MRCGIMCLACDLRADERSVMVCMAGKASRCNVSDRAVSAGRCASWSGTMLRRMLSKDQ